MPAISDLDLYSLMSKRQQERPYRAKYLYSRKWRLLRLSQKKKHFFALADRTWVQHKKSHVQDIAE